MRYLAFLTVALLIALAPSGVADVRRPSYYVLTGQTSSHNPVDSTTVYAGPFIVNPGTGEGIRQGVFTQSGVITRIDFHAIVTVVASGNEDSSLTLRINAATPTGGTIDAALEHNAGTIENAYTGLAIPVTAGDKYELQIVYPAFSTNPTGVLYSWTITVRLP